MIKSEMLVRADKMKTRTPKLRQLCKSDSKGDFLVLNKWMNHD